MADPTQTNRVQTDDSLRDERSKTDGELAKRRAIVESNADEIVSLAQRRADAVLALAHDRADRSMQSATEIERVATERALDAEVLAAERSSAREQLQLERASRAEIIAELLLFERTRTDTHLASERAAADATLGARDDFLGMVSHDLRSMLHAIGLSAELILRDVEADAPKDRIREDALRSIRQVTRMHRLLGDLLDIAAIDAGRLRVELAEEDAAKVVRETAHAHQPLAAATTVEIAIDTSADSLPAFFDRERIMQVLTNLVTNAVKFTDPGGKITISAAATAEGVRFAVRDTGCGIPGDRLATIFDRFAQASRDRRGVGLGLYISRSIVEAHGGRLSVESKLGEGSVFTFDIPHAECNP